jgi:hypothetical protein
VADDITKRPMSEPMYGGDVNGLAKAMRDIVDLVDNRASGAGDTTVVTQVNEVSNRTVML